ncbi:hypothetical protein BW737_003350 [Actinomyces ruminis]|uniref:Uncharacterized protein n=1 Tax=Actinomyces ruminis TaxID=1937003 RepID=A0ABX4MCV4_9ACTO|nr:hypothetical protein BW737_003350 [Actinomyces ruminis]
MHLEVEAERLTNRLREHRTVASGLEGVGQPLSGEDDLEDTVIDAAGLGVGADQRPGGPPRALGRIEHLLPASADHLGVGGAGLCG